MRTKKGFTLMEILTVIAIIGIIMLIAIPSIMGISKSIKRRQLETKKKVIISAAEVYAKNNVSEFGGGDILRIPVRTLLYYGYITKEAECSESIGCIVNPVDDSSMNDEIITIKRNLTITQAEWGKEYGNEMCATFDWNDGSGRIESRCCSEAYKKCEIKTPTITRNGFEILGWNTTSTATEGKIEEDTKITITGSVTYYGITKKNVVVTFNPNGGQIISGKDRQKCSYYNKKTSCTVTAPGVKRTGYKLDGWYDENNNLIDLSKVTSSLTVTAHWSANKLYVQYNGNGGTWAANSEFNANSNGYVTRNGSIYKAIVEYGKVYNSTSGLLNYNNSDYIKFTKTGYHGAKTVEWYIDNNGTKTMFNQADTTVTSNQLAEAGGCDLSSQDCTVTLRVNWDINKLYVQYNGNGGEWHGNDNLYQVNEWGTVVLKSTSSTFLQILDYGTNMDSNGLLNYNNSSYLNWTKANSTAESGKEYIIKGTSVALGQDVAYSVNELASHATNCDFATDNCVIQLKVNWKNSCPDGSTLNTETNKCEYPATIASYNCVANPTDQGSCWCSVSWENLDGLGAGNTVKYNCGSYKTCDALCSSLIGKNRIVNSMPAPALNTDNACTSGSISCSGGTSSLTCPSGGCAGNDLKCHLYQEQSCPSGYTVQTTNYTCPNGGTLSNTMCIYD